MPFVSDALRRYDIPVHSLKVRTGCIRTSSPQGMRDSAKKAMKMKKQLANIDMHTFEMNDTSPSSMLLFSICGCSRKQGYSAYS